MRFDTQISICFGFGDPERKTKVTSNKPVGRSWTRIHITLQTNGKEAIATPKGKEPSEPLANDNTANQLAR